MKKIFLPARRLLGANHLNMSCLAFATACWRRRVSWSCVAMPCIGEMATKGVTPGCGLTLPGATAQIRNRRSRGNAQAKAHHASTHALSNTPSVHRNTSGPGLRNTPGEHE